jgi:thiamine-phosphate pyrophosphorylase
MNSRKTLLKESRLYLIVDKKISGENSIFDIVAKIKISDVDIIQYRDKESKKDDILRNAFLIRRLLLKTKNLFIINDYLDIAKLVDSDGVHLGQCDTPIEIARCILGKDKIIGISCHNLKQALEAQTRGADYIGIGPIFATPTKPKYKPIGLDLIKVLKKKIKIPFFVIGDMNLNNISRVLSVGAERVAVCRAILQAKNISSAIRDFSLALR